MKQKETGFTLVELLVSITLIGIVVTAVTTLFTSIQSVQRRTAYMETATREAQRQMESLRNNNYNNLTAGQTIDFTDELPEVLQNPSGTVTVSEPDPGLKRVDIQVVYYEGEQQQQVELSSLVGILGITQ
jgi:prepilin-type N-terminal cleavage/methylation domain-containing protein